MEIGKTLYVTNRTDWRKWLENNFDSSPEIWLIFYKKASNMISISYDHAVEEALCFGWIDSIIKKIDFETRAQRFTPRRKGSSLSELNKERIRRMMKAGKMEKAGLDVIKDHLIVNNDGSIYLKNYVIPMDIIKELKKDPQIWHNFNAFPQFYKNIRCAFIDDARQRPDEFKKRMNYFIKMTALNKKYGSIK